MSLLEHRSSWVVALGAVLLSGCLPAEVLSVKESSLGEDVVLLEGGGGNTVIVTRGHTTFVFDTKMWPGDGSVEEAVQEAQPARLIVVSSHAHVDHTAGNRLFPDALFIAAPDALAELVADAPEVEAPQPAIPTVPVSTQLHLQIAGEPVMLVHPGPAHTSGDLFAWLPRMRMLLTGDLFDHGFYPHVDAGRGGTYVGLIKALEQLAQYPADVVIPGHGRKGAAEDIEATLRFLRDVRDGVATRRARHLGDEQILAELLAPAGETLHDLGGFSSREKVVRGLLLELADKQ